MGKSERYLARIDGRLLRALAHPLRVRILELLRADGPATASGLAKRVGESSGTTSWHLRQLAEYGLVTDDVERGNRRDRWWKAVHEGDQLHGKDFLDDPELAGPFSAYAHTLIEQRYAAESRFIGELADWADEWIDKVNFHDSSLSLTPDEAVALSDEILEVIARYRRPERDGDTPVRVHWAAFPRRARPERP
ncbi:ArsR/SmtB family transcription factor [Amycolatopsis regifaucium]|uniref:Transcriptional regulator n=1 Tax=Amycolatopsis regifaucium TaxID=546365 RepID=A0A154MVU6_9PSEU|nr:helix-turn-helix domain-containing protein [Amycolatopsis regifaucium]KZB88073.1 ArsR family transcriptional regulator [Amycolatopsis regifaucium]OKA04423.1 transcriptional regulator [Amycolatopsis regifaucium]SFH48796.1 Helix-turn-helix domain-containing protein [Amycolatopsis regifaucium]